MKKIRRKIKQDFLDVKVFIDVEEKVMLTHSKINTISVTLGLVAGLIAFFISWYFLIHSADNKSNSTLDTVQKRTMFTLGLLWDDKDTHLCKTKNYLVKVNIADGNKAYQGLSYPIVSINGSPFVKAKAYGDFLSDRQEWVFYHDNSIGDDLSFTVRFDWYRPNDKNPDGKAQCFFETTKNNKTIFEYGDIIRHDAKLNKDF